MERGWSLIESALAHAARRGHAAPCLMLDWTEPDTTIHKLLADTRIGSLGVKDREPASPQDDHLTNPRLGRYFAQGDWSLPSPHEAVYFLGPVYRVTPLMISRAMNGEVQRLLARLGSMWVRVPTQSLRSFVKPVRLAYRLRQKAIHLLVRVLHKLHALKAITILNGYFLKVGCERLVKDARPRSDYITGRVVIVCGNLSPGGAERQAANTAVGLIESNIKDIHFLAHNLHPGPENYDFHLPRVRAAGVRVREIERAPAGVDDPAMPDALHRMARRLPYYRNGFLSDIADLVREFENLRPEVVHAWLDWDTSRAGLAAAIAGVPKIILSGRNINPSHFPLYQPYMDPAYRALAKLAHVTIINNSRAGADDYADWIGIARDRIKVVHNGISFGELGRLAPEKIAAERHALGIGENDFVVGGIFRFEAEKQPLLWLEVAKLVRNAVPDARFLLHGQGRLHNAVEAKIKELGLSDCVVLRGVTDAPLAAMSLMDVFLLTSYGEGLPNVLLEAQWVGTPIVCTRAGGAPEAIDDGKSGWVVDAHAPQAIADAIIRVRRHPDIAPRAAAHGPIFVRERFGNARMIAETLNVYGISEPLADGEMEQRDSELSQIAGSEIITGED